ncbi:hypothetical protein ABL78_5845 [Leptomonas seymouri]|uniref:Leishmanolysin n=1 Tax=Leptomonas seymouri TaxID=5684 RepID=A0A0N0P4A9_LEPSE|nr:hypothetical protein ABL78_5845 [Leptomonas seymouri]|eukprot:KPI85079.1 hypothetical protein ABL78_5845 [Leptomonas seymouri]
MPPPCARQAFWLLMIVMAFTLSQNVCAAAKTCGGNACTPYVPAANRGTGCVRKNPINLRFLLDMATENSYKVKDVVQTQATYALAPCVDDLSALALNSAPFLTSGYAVTNTTPPAQTSYFFSSSRTDKYLSVYGFGMSNQTARPEIGVSPGAVLVAKNGLDACGNAATVGVVTILSLEIGLRRGFFSYLGFSNKSTSMVANPNYDPKLCKEGNSFAGSHNTAASTPPDKIDYCSKAISTTIAENHVQPARVGFVPTCNERDQCMLGDPDMYVCIGNVTGQKNCGMCFSDATALAANSSLTVWVRYVGTDLNNVVLTSGGDNPMDYSSFVSSEAFQTISRKFNSLIRGNFSEFGLPVGFLR